VHKSDRTVHLLALDRLGLPVDEAVAFEDTAHGPAAAHGPGCAAWQCPTPNPRGNASFALRSRCYPAPRPVL
jgi:beta-phosphoglucomutase-like phosphatase (HAD superfamily)